MGVEARPAKFVRFRHRNIPDRELVRDLRRVARETGRECITWRLYATRGKFRPRTLAHRFGSWNAALQMAGLPVIQLKGATDAALFDNLAAVWRKFGRQPTGRELTKRDGLSKFGESTYRLRFGSWHKALDAFETFVNDGSRGARLPQRLRPRPTKPRPRSLREINWRLRATVLIRDNCLCRMCGASPAKDPAVTLHVDHIVPWSKGGQTVLGNLQTLCAACNIGKGDWPLVRTDGGRRSARRRK
jgi:HNH endonuclease/Homing endonuclease associated repeat